MNFNNFKVIQTIYLFSKPYSTKALKKFPVPKLEDTLKKYVRYLSPIMSKNEWATANEVTNNFFNSIEAQKLQDLLVRRSEIMSNWLSDWWTNVAYLEGRSPLVVHSNPGLRVPFQNFNNREDWLKFSSEYLTSFLHFKNEIDNNKLQPDMLKDEPLCMNQHYSIFSTCRIPGSTKDSIYCAKSHTLPPHKRPNFITVLHNNRIFKMEVCNKETGEIYSSEALQRGFSDIIDKSQDRGVPIGIMTSEHRDSWNKTHARLIENDQNREVLETIHQSILMFCLDRPVLSNNSDENLNSLVSKNMLHGMTDRLNSGNRWFDKTLQLICTSDGGVGINYEHTPAEAPPIASMIEEAWLYVTHQKEHEPSTSRVEVPAIQELEFQMDKQTCLDIDVASDNLNNLIEDLELHAIQFSDFGKTRIKGSKVSPDAFVQLGIQLGYFNVHGELGSTYESGSLRRFEFGRTDTIRSCSPEVLEFCNALKGGSANKEECKRLLIAALKRHTTYTKEVMAGEGIDRHLLGLKLIARENKIPLPDFFSHSSYQKAFHHKLSTSQGGSDIVDVNMSFGPLVSDGYGFCYNPTKSSVLVSVSAMNSCADTNALKLGQSIFESWHQMIDLLEN